MGPACVSGKAHWRKMVKMSRTKSIQGAGRVTEVSVEGLRKAIRNLHGCDSTWIQAVRVKETLKGETAWDGHVQIFNLIDHQAAVRCYAWSQAIDDSTKRRFVAVLHQEPVTSPGAAVRASMVQQARE